MFAVGDKVRINDPADFIGHDQISEVTDVHVFEHVVVYSVVMRKNWTSTYREEKLLPV
jgi:hypothetical protein